MAAIDYQTVESDTLAGLTVVVQAAIAAGWDVIGNVELIGTKYVQTMIK